MVEKLIPLPSPVDRYLRAIRIMFWIVFFGITSVAAIYAWPAVRAILDLLMPFILGLMLAYVLHPVVVFIQHKLRLGRGMGIFVAGILILGSFAGFLSILGPILVTQVRALYESVTEFFDTSDALNKIFRSLNEADLAELRKLINDGLKMVRDTVEQIIHGDKSVLKPVAAGSLEAAGQTVSAALAAFGWFGALVATTTITSISTIWYLIEMGKVPGVIRRLIPEGPNRRKYWEVMLKANHSVGGFLRGQLIACIGVGLLTTILMLLVGPKKYALLIGFTAGAVNFIPYLGPTVGAAPAVLWALFSSEFDGMSARLIQAGMIIGGFGVIQAIDGFVFQPFIVGPQAALHPLAVMLSLVIGSQFGIGGMILAVPIASALKVVFVELYWKETTDFIETEPITCDIPSELSATPSPPESPPPAKD